MAAMGWPHPDDKAATRRDRPDSPASDETATGRRISTFTRVDQGRRAQRELRMRRAAAVTGWYGSISNVRNPGLVTMFMHDPGPT